MSVVHSKRCILRGFHLLTPHLNSSNTFGGGGAAKVIGNLCSSGVVIPFSYML